MSVFVVCSAVAAAGFAVAFEVGRVYEKRVTGASENALPFENFDWKSEDARTAAKFCAVLFVFEVVFVPRSLNPFAYLLAAYGSSSESSVSHALAFLVFGSWSGILAVGFGGMAASFRALVHEQASLETAKADHAKLESAKRQEFSDEEERLAMENRANIASAAAVKGEWKKLHIAREELHKGAMRAESEQIWSKAVTEDFSQKTKHVVDNAIDQRWREVEDQGNHLEVMRKRNELKMKEIREQRAKRTERASTQKDCLSKEKSNLLKLTSELEGLKKTMERLKKENMQKEQKKIQELKNRELALDAKERRLEQSHNEKYEILKRHESELKEREDRFESGEERKKLRELSEKLESSKLTVAKFNEVVMMKERQKNEEFKQREMALTKREEELSHKAATSIPEPVVSIESEEEMPDDEAWEVYQKEEEGPEDENADVQTVNTEDKSVSIRLLAERDIQPASEDELDSSANDLPMITEDRPSDARSVQSESGTDERSATNKTNESFSIRLLAERDILPASEDETDEAPLEDNNNMTESSDEPEEAVSEEPRVAVDSPSGDKSEILVETPDEPEQDVPEEEIREDEEPTDITPTIEDDSSPVEEHEVTSPKHVPVSLMDAEEDEEHADDESVASGYKIDHGMGLDVVDQSRIDKVVNETSLLDSEEEEEEEEIEEDEDDEVDDESTCLLNANFENPRPPLNRFKSLSEIDDEDSNDSSCLLNTTESCEAIAIQESGSENDSLSYQIQNDIAEKQRMEELNAECSSSTSIIDPAEEDVPPPVSSPLKSMENDAYGIPVSPTSATNASTASFKDAIPLSPTSGTNYTADFKDALTISPTTSDPEYVILNKAEKENGKSPKGKKVKSPKGKKVKTPRNDNKKSLVVTEEAAVEVIAWMENGVL